MPLSEHEQRLLEQIEQALYAEDPKFASTYRSTNLTTLHRRRLVKAGLVVLTGLAALLAGVVTKIYAIGVAGFLVMLAGAWLAVATWQRMSGRRREPADAPARAPRAKRPRRSVLGRLEDRWERRQEGNGRF